MSSEQFTSSAEAQDGKYCNPLVQSEHEARLHFLSMIISAIAIAIIFGFPLLFISFRFDSI